MCNFFLMQNFDSFAFFIKRQGDFFSFHFTVAKMEPPGKLQLLKQISLLEKFEH